MSLVFAPDADPSQPGIITGTGLRPTATGYANYPRLSRYVGTSGWNSFPGTVTTLYAHTYQQTGRLFGGTTASNLYQLTRSGSTFALAIVSKGGDPYTGISGTSTSDETAPQYWTFTSFGNVALASHRFLTNIQAQTATGNLFVDVAGPPCSTLATFKNFIVAGNCGNYGSVVGTNDMVAWSAFGDYTNWTPALSTQAGNAQLTDVPGRIVALLRLGDSLAVYKENAIWLMRYLNDGQGNTWSFELVNNVVGVNAAYNVPPPIVDIGGSSAFGSHIFVGREDIYLFNGFTTQALTTGTVRQYLHDNFYEPTLSRLAGTLISHDMRAGEIAFWKYGLVYNYRLNKWGALPVDPPAAVIATCTSASSSIDFGSSGVINDAPALVVRADNVLWNRYLYSGDTSTVLYGDMVLNANLGDNGTATRLDRIVPKFKTIPTSNGQLSYSRLQTLGGASVADGSAVWDSANARFDIGKTAYWHQLAITFPSAAPFELMDLQYSVTANGKRVEFPLQ